MRSEDSLSLASRTRRVLERRPCCFGDGDTRDIGAFVGQGGGWRDERSEEDKGERREEQHYD